MIILQSAALLLCVGLAFGQTKPLAAGAVAPDFTLSDQNGKQVTFSQARGEKIAVLVFYRGYWCPFCRRQLAELRTLLTKDDNVLLYAISIDPPAKAKEMAARIAQDGKGDINFPLLSDPQHKTIDDYGIRDTTHDGQEFAGIPHPAVYVIGKDGKIIWAKVEDDYRKRPSNEDIRQAWQP
jgi:peroxiredoxin